MSILVSGSVALDHIMVFPDRFKDHILPDKLHILNVSFNIESLETHFGGVAGNMAYHLRQLGEDPLILASVGNDFGPYAEWLDRHGIRRDAINVIEDVRTPQGFVTTDLDDNQIWAFYEGAKKISFGDEHSVVDPFATGFAHEDDPLGVRIRFSVNEAALRLKGPWVDKDLFGVFSTVGQTIEDRHGDPIKVDADFNGNKFPRPIPGPLAELKQGLNKIVWIFERFQ